MVLGVGQVKKSIAYGDISTPASFSIPHSLDTVYYYGTYLISFTGTGDSVLVFIGWNKCSKIAEDGGGFDKLNISVSGVNVTISVKDGVQNSQFYVYAV